MSFARSILLALLFAALGLAGWLGAPLVPQMRGQPGGALALTAYSGRLVVGRSDGIWVIPLDGGAPSQLAGVDSGSQITGVTWSPSGTQVAYTRFSFEEGSVVGGADLHVVDLFGNDRVLAQRDDLNTVLGTPTWAPDGGSILFDVTQIQVGGVGGTQRRIDRVSADGTLRSTELSNAYQPSLSRNGSVLSFMRQEGNGVSIHVRSLLSGADTLALAPGMVSGIIVPSISPDGSTVVFGAASGPGLVSSPARCNFGPVAGLFEIPRALAHGLPEEVWRVSGDGSGLSRMTDLCLDDPILAWSPDSAWIAELGSTNLLLLNASGGSPVTIWNDGGYGGVDWTN